MNRSFPGLYTYMDSPIHRAPPGLKIAIGFILGPYILLFTDIYTLSFTTLALVTIMSLAKGKILKLIKGLWPSYPFLALISVLHLAGGDATSGLLVPWRFFLILLLSSILTFTTSSKEMATVVERILRPLPLKPFGISSRDLSMMFIMAIRFFPLFFEEMERLKNAQRARAFDPRKLGLRRWISFLPLFVMILLNGLLRRAGEVAKAMEARAYRPGHGIYLKG